MEKIILIQKHTGNVEEQNAINLLMQKDFFKFQEKCPNLLWILGHR